MSTPQDPQHPDHPQAHGWGQEQVPPPPPQYGPPTQFGQPPQFGQPVAGPQTEPMAIVGLILAVVGVCFCGIVLSSAGAVLGYLARQRIAASGGSRTGDGLALAAMIVGVVGALLNVIWIVVAVAGSGSLFFPGIR